jgi:type 1 fimbriae regulatory protein FimB
MPTDQRLRDYLTRDEVAALLGATKRTRHGPRNHAMILRACRHGLRASEVTNLRVSDVDLERGTIYCRRTKGSRSGVHSMKSDEVAAMVKLLRDRKPVAREFVFRSERGERLTRNALW